MNRKTFILEFFLFLFLIAGCTRLDIPSPEKNYEYFYAAINAANFKMFSNCFDKDTELYNEKNLRILADRMFNQVEIISHRIIKKENIRNKEASILAEEITKKKGIKTKSIFRINYIKSGGGWRIISSENLSLVELSN